ncbi:hypothetical protein [Vreelandella neptunia]|uniref:hypothetical protein n=1 Tax=Vreelandella neptunia TaxID=115551 RepID=UPI00315B2488
MGSAALFSGQNIAPLALFLLKIPRNILAIKHGNGRCNPALLSACGCNKQASKQVLALAGNILPSTGNLLPSRKKHPTRKNT